MSKLAPIGVFDSGYGGLTILSEIRRLLPEYDFIYLGDNARSPYGTRSFDVIRDFTTEAVRYLFDEGCPLVILACNTASAKALREIQQRYLPISEDPTRRVLGVIRPTAEVVGNATTSGHIGVLATPGTVSAHSYQLELQKLFPDITVHEQACPMWVPLVEYGESASPGADYFVQLYLDQLLSRDERIDSIVLACTHYPLLRPKIEQYLPKGITLISQGELVAHSLCDYLARHPEMDRRLSKGASISYRTTECPDKFEGLASIFIDQEVAAVRVKIDH
ncbi:MAG: glutamate racemase [Porphyromonas sp.]|nr:glutamate racemase [Porphyromonas sp.]